MAWLYIVFEIPTPRKTIHVVVVLSQTTTNPLYQPQPTNPCQLRFNFLFANKRNKCQSAVPHKIVAT